MRSCVLRTHTLTQTDTPHSPDTDPLLGGRVVRSGVLRKPNLT
jgi:hypothetical protein